MASGVELAEVDLGIDEAPASASAAITCDRAVELVGFGSFHVWLTLILTLGNAADAVEVMSIGLVLPNLTHLSDADKGALTAAVFAGALVGAVAWGLAGDLVGRRPALVASLLLNGLSALASSAVGEHLGALCACRFFAGIGVAGANAVAFTLLPEFLPASRRGAGVVVLASGWMCGSVYSAAVGWIVIPKSGWRAFLAAAAAPALVAAAAAAARVPESPRFLCARGRGLEAAAVVRAVSRRTRSSRLHEGFRLRGTDAAGKSSEARRKRETSFFLFGENRRVFPARFPAIAAIWFALSFGWYGTMLWLPEAFARDKSSSSFRDSDANGRVSQRVYLENLLVALAAAPGNVASAFSVDAVGRVKTLLVGACGACASALAFAAVAAVSRDARAKTTAGDEKDDWFAFVLCACLFNALSVGGWNALDLLSAESFPTRARATALGILGAVGRVGAFAGTSAMGLVVGGSAGGGALWAPFLVAAAAMALAALAASGAAETAGTRLGALGEAGDDDDDDDGFDDDDASSGDAGALLGRAASSSSAAGDAGWRVPERSVKVVLPVDA